MAGSGQLLFDRRCRLTIANPIPGSFKDAQTFDVVEIDGGRAEAGRVGMRVKFKIDKTDKKEPNTSEVIVTNLSKARRASLQKNGVKVLLEAGYAGTGFARYFVGDVRTTDHIKNGADMDTTMKLGDGERAWKFARVSESFSPKTLIKDAAKKIGTALGLGLGNLEAKLADLTDTFEAGWVAHGSAATALDQIIVDMLGKTWSIQDGVIQVLDPYEVANLPIPELTPETGLIGSPEMGSPPSKGKPALLTVKGLLFPIKPGGKLKLRSERYDGFVRAHKVSFEGDTGGGDWYTTVEGTIIK